MMNKQMIVTNSMQVIEAMESGQINHMGSDELNCFYLVIGFFAEKINDAKMKYDLISWSTVRLTKALVNCPV
jgi:hypothetical protein